MTHTPPVRLIIIAAVACGCTVLACSRPEEADTAQSVSSSQDVALLVGNHEVVGRTVLVRLPYYRNANHIWVSADDDAETGPFVFQTIDIEPGRGPGGTDVSVYEYKARGAGTGTMRFGLVPVGKSIIGPPETRHEGPAFATYAATVTVE